MLIKLMASAAVAIVWLVLIVGNLAAAGRTAASMQSLEGVDPGLARRRTTSLVFAWSVVITVIAIVALVMIW
jgi:hypothetical protein